MLAKQKVWLAMGIEAELDGVTGDLYNPADSVPATFDPREVDLVERLRAGELEAFSELVAEYQPLLFSLTLRIVRDEEEARDVVQETFLKIYRHFAHFRGESSLKTWLCRIAVNQALNSQRWWKRRRREVTRSLDDHREEQTSLASQLPSQEATPEARTLAHERQLQLERALNELKPDFRIAVVLRDIEGMAYEEIASILEISVGTVKSRIARGREMLRSRLAKF